MSYYDSEGNLRNDNGTFLNLNGPGTENAQEQAGGTRYDSRESAFAKLITHHAMGGSRTESTKSSDEGGGHVFALLIGLVALIFIGFPVAAVWHYRRKNWIYLSFTVIAFAFALLTGYFLTQPNGLSWAGLLTGSAIFGLVYAPFALVGWISHRIADKITKRAPLKMTRQTALILAAVGLPGAVLSFIFMPVGSPAGIMDISIAIALALIPALLAFSIAIILLAWFTRRLNNKKNAVPKLLYVPVPILLIFTCLIAVLAVKEWHLRAEHARQIAQIRAAAQLRNSHAQSPIPCTKHHGKCD